MRRSAIGTVLAGAALAAAAGAVMVSVLGSPGPGPSPFATSRLTPGPSPTRAAGASASVGGAASPDTTAIATLSPPRLLFGLGSELDGALAEPLTRDAPVHLLSSWFNGTDDLRWMAGWSKTLIPDQYAAGRSLHLIVYTNSPNTTTQTAYGPACGRGYPLTAQFQTDMAALARIWAGHASGPALYVTLFTEFQTYACHPSAWLPDDAYWRALQDAYTSAETTFRKLAPNARVSLGWGGWQARSDDPAMGGGRSMFKYFAPLLAGSGFESFQAMQDDSNVSDVLAMTQALSPYGPVMLAHYKPNDGSQTVFDADTAAMLNDDFLRRATAAGLFAWSFMDARNMDASPDTYQRIVAAIRRFGGQG